MISKIKKNKIKVYRYKYNNTSYEIIWSISLVVNVEFFQQNNAQNNFMLQKYVSAIRSINSTSSNYGKDGKFQIFICLACRY